MSIIKPEVLPSVGSHSEVREPVLKSVTAHVSVKFEAVIPPQPSIAHFRCEYCPQEFSLKQYLIEHVHEAHGSLSKPCKPEQLQFDSSIVKPVNPDVYTYEH
eukprot:903068_1